MARCRPTHPVGTSTAGGRLGADGRAEDASRRRHENHSWYEPAAAAPRWLGIGRVRRLTRRECFAPAPAAGQALRQLTRADVATKEPLQRGVLRVAGPGGRFLCHCLPIPGGSGANLARRPSSTASGAESGLRRPLLQRPCEPGDVQTRILLCEPPLGLAPASELAQTTLALLGPEVRQRMHPSGPGPPGRQVE